MRPPRIPGFAADVAFEPERRASRPPSLAAKTALRGAATRQLNVRLLEPLDTRYRGLLRELADDGYPTTMTELLHALLYAGPADPPAARQLIHRWRRALEPDENE